MHVVRPTLAALVLCGLLGAGVVGLVRLGDGDPRGWVLLALGVAGLAIAVSLVLALRGARPVWATAVIAVAMLADGATLLVVGLTADSWPGSQGPPWPVGALFLVIGAACVAEAAREVRRG